MPQDDVERLSLAGQLEALITEYYYARGTSQQARRRCYAAGVQVPLWLWTHEASTRAELKDKELRKATHLVEWILQQEVDPTKVAVLMPLEWRKDFRVMLAERLQQRYRAQVPTTTTTTTTTTITTTAMSGETPEPIILTHYELSTMQKRDKVRYHYDVVLYVFGLFPSLADVAAARRQEENLVDALAAATHSFILSMDAGWVSPTLRQQWPQWRSFHEKLAEEQPFVSTASAGPDGAGGEERLPALIGSSLPICCARHPEQRQLVHGMTNIVLNCKHLCMRPYDCGTADHLCAAHCHPLARDHHHVCPYACQKPMPCGHTCLMTCSARCNCYQVVENPLLCSHQEVIGLDKASLEPIYATVQHVFKGVCADKGLPCTVQYTTECMRCLGKFTVKCYEAQEQGHSLLHKTMVCDPCKRTERELRASILGDVLCANEEEKKKLKVEMEKTLHEQRKAASHGLFKPGTRVVIRDATKCVPPISAEDDFPGVLFIDMDDPNVFADLEGAYGTFVSSHVDVMDSSEIRSLIRLPDGHHVLVTDGGLDVIRALTSQITSAHRQRLLLTASAPQSTSNAADGTAVANAALSPEFAAARALVGQRMYVAQPIPCAAMEDGVLADKVVVVKDVDPTSPLNVMIECALSTVPVAHTAMRDAADEVVSPGTKRPRSPEDGDENTAAAPTEAPEADDATRMLVSCSAPIAHLEEMSGLSAGQMVNVTCPERQITDPRDLELLGASLHSAPASSTAAERLTSAPLNADTAYELVTIVNPPLHMTQKVGPCAILRTRPHAVTVVAAKSRRGRGRPGDVAASRAPRAASVAAAAQLLAVPFMFLAADELTEAEHALDAAAQKQYERRVEDAIQQVSEDKALRNDEDEFHRQQQMPEVTPSMMQQVRVAHSAPAPPPTTSQVAEAKVRFNRLPIASSTATRMMALKDKLVFTQETKARGSYITSVRERLDRDQLAARAHLEEVNRRLHNK